MVCNLLEGADALGHGGAEGRCSSSAVPPTAAAYRRVVADLTGRAVRVPAEDELVAAGAAVQAAAVHHGCNFAAGGRRMGTRPRRHVEPDETVDRLAIRAAYADAVGRDRLR